MIPVFKPSITKREIDAVVQALKSGWIGLGPITAKFEKEFAKYVNSEYAVSLNSCTAALHLSLYVLDLKDGDEVIVPPITFVSTAHAVVYNRAKPVFCDVDPSTLCIDVKDLEKRITKRTKAIIPVHYAGHPCDLDKIHSIAKERGIEVIEDAAHACGAVYKGKQIGSISRLTCFSFHAVKNLTCGEGGIITTSDKELYERLMRIRWMGITKDTWRRTEESRIYAWQYWVNELGFKAHLNDIASSIGSVQLKRLTELNAKRRRIVEAYNRAFKSLDCVQTPPERDYVKSSWHIYHLKTEHRDDLIGHLKKRGIAPGVHYYPVNMHPYYRKRSNPCPVAGHIWKKIITLPLFPDLKETEVSYIIDSVKAFYRHPRFRNTFLYGKKVKLRSIQWSDLELIREWRNKNRKLFFNQDKVSPQAQYSWYESYLKSENERMFIIEHKEVAVGFIALKVSSRIQGSVERVLIAREEDRSKGYGLDSVKTLLKYLFSNFKLRKINVELFAENIAAKNLYSKLGFREEKINYRLIGKKRRKILLMNCSKNLR